MSNKENLIAYLIKNGKDLSWHELAKGFGYPTGDAARCAWSNYKRDNPNIPTYVDKPAKNPLTFSINRRNGMEKEQYAMDLEDRITKYEEDVSKGTAQVEALVSQEIKTLEELVTKCNIDLTKWEITKWVQNFWNNRYQVKAYLAPKQEKDIFQQSFIRFLKDYVANVKPSPVHKVLQTEATSEWAEEEKVHRVQLPKGCLLINKQDFHFDKLDVYGNNDIPKRFDSFRNAVGRLLRKTQLSYTLSEVVYILGSDAFNCEWTGMTTKGTPQKNAIDYHTGFQAILDHEIQVIKDLTAYCPMVKVLYIPGNHDEYVGWHLVQALSAIFKGNSTIRFDIDPSYRKYYKFGNSAMMFNHGDTMKPQKLASIFPQEFREHWSSCSYQYIFTGDKHHEMSLDIDGIIFYQLGQGSNATSQWDSKMGHQARGFLTAFVLSEDWGLADTLKERL